MLTHSMPHPEHPHAPKSQMTDIDSRGDGESEDSAKDRCQHFVQTQRLDGDHGEGDVVEHVREGVPWDDLEAGIEEVRAVLLWALLAQVIEARATLLLVVEVDEHNLLALS